MSECEACGAKGVHVPPDGGVFEKHLLYEQRQAALLAAERAKVEKLRAALEDVIDTEGCGCCEAMNFDASVPNTSKNDHGTAVDEARRALEGEGGK